MTRKVVRDDPNEKLERVVSDGVVRVGTKGPGTVFSVSRLTGNPGIDKMVVFRSDPCGIVCLIVTYSAILYADYVVVRHLVIPAMSDS